jgi:hypothetical protein
MLGMLGCVYWYVLSDVSEEPNAPIFSVKQYKPWAAWPQISQVYSERIQLLTIETLCIQGTVITRYSQGQVFIIINDMCLGQYQESSNKKSAHLEQQV